MSARRPVPHRTRGLVVGFACIALVAVSGFSPARAVVQPDKGVVAPQPGVQLPAGVELPAGPPSASTVGSAGASAPGTVDDEGARARKPGEQDEVAGRVFLEAQIDWRDSRAVGLPYDGRLVDGVQLPIEGQNFFTWDAVHNRLGNPDERRWGTDELLLTVLGVLDSYRAASPDAPRVGISDLSREEGGEFGVYYGGQGHTSHQSGLDIDIAYPRRDGAELGITDPSQVDMELSQDLVDRFVAAGAKFVFTGVALDLTGPPDVVRAIPNHNDHLHLRIHPQP